ncbi:MAG: RraA family protein [Trueperaceae bacterium]|nr:MAG: RraA family protein [Trueperaceae bacterium]
MNANDSAVEELRRLSTSVEGLSCIVSDALGRTGAMHSEVRAMWSGARLVGSARTAKPHGNDVSAVFSAIERARPGDVIVIEGCGGGPVAFWGENATLLALRRGLVGTVMGAPCRDVQAHIRLSYPVFSVGATPAGGTFGQRGEVDVPVSVGGIVATPGDVLVADENGVTVVPGAQLDAVVAAIPDLLRKEREIQDDIAAGHGLSRRRP